MTKKEKTYCNKHNESFEQGRDLTEITKSRKIPINLHFLRKLIDAKEVKETRSIKVRTIKFNVLINSDSTSGWFFNALMKSVSNFSIVVGLLFSSEFHPCLTKIWL
jgi:hypothetical protein